MKLTGSDAEVEKYIKQVDDLDSRVEELEKVVKELEEWTGELGMILPSTSQSWKLTIQ